MIAPARIAAFETLRAVSTGRADLPHALARARDKLPDERDRALAGEIATGTLRWQAACDHLIAAFTGRSLARLDLEVLVILRLSIFQLLHLERVPASAVVNDAVSLSRRAGKKSAGPLVNAVLRRVSRERARLPLPPRPAPDAEEDAQLDYLSITLSHPRWLVARWLRRYGPEAAGKWAEYDNSPAPLTLRANRFRVSPEQLAETLAGHGVATVAGRYAPDALIVTAGNPLLTPLARDGSFVVQEEGSQLVALLAGVGPGDRVLDACASPGGKTTAMAAALHGRGLIVACDVRDKRVDLLARTVRGTMATGVRIVQADAASALPFREEFDRVLLDAPCSGLGTLRRDPDLRWRREEDELPHLAAFQLRMLRETARVLRPGGRLVYATCSSEPEENEAVVAEFLSAGGFRAVTPELPPPASQMINEAGQFRSYPFRDGIDAFFATVLVKEQG